MSHTSSQPVHRRLCWPLHSLATASGCQVLALIPTGGIAAALAMRCSRCPGKLPWVEQQPADAYMHSCICVYTHTRIKFMLHKHQFLLPPSICLFYSWIVNVCYWSILIFICSRKLHSPVKIFSQAAHVFFPHLICSIDVVLLAFVHYLAPVLIAFQHLELCY